MGNLLAELKRRNVFRVADGYAVVASLLAQMVTVLESAMNMPPTVWWSVDELPEVEF